MAKKTTMKRKMKKRGSRRCWGGADTPTQSKRSKTKTPKGYAYAKQLKEAEANRESKLASKRMSKKVDDLSDLFTSSMYLSNTSPKNSVK
jgi:hypothetical protein